MHCLSSLNTLHADWDRFVQKVLYGEGKSWALSKLELFLTGLSRSYFVFALVRHIFV